MKAADYLEGLRSALGLMEKMSREDFIREIESHIADLKERHPEEEEETIVAGLTPPDLLAAEVLGARVKFPVKLGRVEDILRNFPAAGIEKVSVSAFSSDLRLERGAGELIRVTARGSDNPERLFFAIEGATLRMEERADTGRPLEEIVLELPNGLDFIELRSQSGDVDCEGIDADLSIETASGDVSLRKVDGDCGVKSSSGDIEVGGGGSISASTASGDIHVFEARGDVVARSASGHIRIEEVDGSAAADSSSGDIEMRGIADRVGAKNVSGEITIEDCEGAIAIMTTSGTVEVDCSEGFGGATVSTVSGDITVNLPADPDAVVRATSRSGDISIGDREGDRGEVVLGSGGSELALTSLSGDIAVEW